MILPIGLSNMIGNVFGDEIDDGSNVLVLTNDHNHYDLSAFMDIYEDPTKKLTFSDISSPAFEHEFGSRQFNIPSLGYTNSVI